ncbi:MarR family transcriptional regulator [bacterium]|nr:MarR family transcriptional regulator [bacterium]
MRCTAEALRHHGDVRTDGNRLSSTQFTVMESLFLYGAMNQRELAQHSQRTTGNITVVVDNLEKRGLVSRCSVENDRRVSQVGLTDDGKSLISSLLPAHDKLLLDTFSVLNEDELVQFETLCQRLNDRVHGNLDNE